MPEADSAYCGRILNGPYTMELKKHVRRCLRSFGVFESTGVPSIPYISAWQDKDIEIWYEYVGRGLLRLFDCQPSQVAARLRSSVVDRHDYRIDRQTPQIQKHSIDKAALEQNRDRLRAQGRHEGFVDAVYKLCLPGGKTIWLKDLAIIEIHPQDRLCLSLGSLTIVTKEMRAEEERLARERLEVSLEMAGGVCHELNQPLQTLSGYAESLLTSTSADDPHYPVVAKIMECCGQMGKITGKLMRITKYATKNYLQGIRIVDIDRASGEKDK
jgi:signal transduction histidine kinase